MPEYRLNERYRMVSAVGEQSAISLWDYAIDANGTYWLWPTEHKEPGAMVHVGETLHAGQRYSEGYSGRTMQFPTKDGIVKIQGPWHTNADALFHATGVDLRDKHLTWGLIALRREYDKHIPVFRYVLHLDPDEGVVGPFDRISKQAQAFATEGARPIAYYSRSHSGSSCGYEYPKNWTREQVNDYFNSEKAGVR
jgi:hypothetical protein